MTLNTNRNKKNKLGKAFVITSTLLAVSVLCLFALEKLQITNFISMPQPNGVINAKQPVIDNNPPTTEQKAAGELQKKDSIDTPQNNDLGISITNIDTSNDPVSIKSVISGAVSNSGTCTLTLTKNDVTIAKSAGTYALPKTSTCKGFDIAKSELSAGEWQLQLSVSVDTKTSSISDKFNLE